jgi:hypothetical protein
MVVMAMVIEMIMVMVLMTMKITTMINNSVTTVLQYLGSAQSSSLRRAVPKVILYHLK